MCVAAVGTLTRQRRIYKRVARLWSVVNPPLLCRLGQCLCVVVVVVAECCSRVRYLELKGHVGGCVTLSCPYQHNATNALLNLMNDTSQF
jgi:hypothetical protein